MTNPLDKPSEERVTRIFLSSTSRDLAEHRQTVMRECSDRGYALTMMEEFGAQDDDAKAVSVAEVDPCNVFIGIYARRYGYIPKNCSRSVTEMEYDEAVRLEKPRLVFVVAPDFRDHPLLAKHSDGQDSGAAAGLHRLLDRIGQERVWDTFTTPAHLAQRVNFALSKWEGWQPPTPPALARSFIGRAQLLADVAAALDVHGRVWLGGTGGLGKTFAATHFAHAYAAAFPGGTLWVTLGPDASDANEVLMATMRAWVRRHHPGRLADPLTLASATVRAWLEALPQRLLVVLDDVWHSAPAKEVLQLVPSTAAVLVTSRRGDVVRQLGINCSIELDPLSSDEALQMLRDRVGEMPSRTALRELAAVLDGHPLALELAAAQIQLQGPDYAEQLPALLRQAIETPPPAGSATDADIPKSVGATLHLTYQAMGEDLKRRYRALGALAPEALITPFLMAVVWSLDPKADEAVNDALDRMLALANNGVLSRVPGQQLFVEHALVRAHARRLLSEAGDLDETDDRYARGVVLFAEGKFRGPTETWREMQPYLPHITFVGNVTADRFEQLFGALGPLVDSATVSAPLSGSEHSSSRLLLRGLNFAAAMSTYVRERSLEGDSASRWLRMGIVAARALKQPNWTAKFMLDLGTWLMNHGEPGAAVEHYAEGAQVARTAQDWDVEADALQRLSRAYMATGRYEEAKAVLEKLPSASSNAADRQKLAGIRVAQGELKRRQGDFQGALALYSEALPLLEGSIEQTATVLNNIGLVYRSLGDLPAAARLLQRALEVHRRLGNRREEATALFNLGGVAWESWDLERARTLYEQARQAASEVGNRQMEAQALGSLGTVFDKSGDRASSLACYERALPILRELHDLAGEAATLNNIGVARLQQDPQAALSLLNEALNLNVRLGDRAGQGKVLNVIGDAWYALRDAGKALSSYQASLECCRATGDRGTAAQVLQNLGILYHALKDTGQAERHYNASLEMMRAIGNRNGEAVNLSNLASIAFTSGDHSLAKARLHEALGIMREIGDRRSEAAIQHNLDELESEMAHKTQATPASSPHPSAPAGDAREILIGFLNAEGPMRAIYYARNKAVLQSPQVEAMLNRMVDDARRSRNDAMVTYGQGVLEFLRNMRTFR